MPVSSLSYIKAAYHSKFTNAPKRVGNMAILPLRTKVRGPAPQDPSLEEDIIDEALTYFKPLTFFRNYEFKCSTKSQGSRELTSLSLARFDLPGDAGFPRELSNYYVKPSMAEANVMREYMTQLRTELGLRLLDKVYEDDQSQPSKWWLCFSKRKFLDQSLSAPGY
ncbi:hypothetical protein ACTXT7_003843 [Hymenolepis weldensis]